MERKLFQFSPIWTISKFASQQNSTQQLKKGKKTFQKYCHLTLLSYTSRGTNHGYLITVFHSLKPQRSSIRTPAADLKIGSLTSTVFPRIIAGGDYFYFSTKRGDYSREGDFSREAIVSNISHRRWRSKYFVLLYQAIKKKVKYMNITIEKNCKKPVLL